MAKIHGKSAKFWITDSGGTERDLSNYLNQIDLPMSADAAETSGFGDADKTFVVGLRGRTIRGQGNNDYVTNGPDHVLSGLLGGGASGTVVPTWKYGPAGSVSGSVYYTGSAHITSYQPSSPLGGAQTFSFEGQITGAVTRSTF